MDATVFDVDSELKADVVLADVHVPIWSNWKEAGDQIQGDSTEAGRDCNPSENNP